MDTAKVNNGDVLSVGYWKLNKLMLKSVGLWPYQKSSTKMCIRTFIFIAIYSMMIPQIIRTFEEWGKNSEIVIENITGFLYFHVLITKYVTSCITESNLQCLYVRITEDWNHFRDEGEQKVLSHFASHGRFLTIGYSVYLYTAGITFTTLPCLIPAVLDLIIPLNDSRQKVLCFYGEYFIDQKVYYYELLLHTFVCVMCTIMVFTTIDAAYACCIEHVIGLFHIVDYRLNQAFNLVKDKYDTKSEGMQSEIHKCVLRSIEVHNHSIEIVELIQTTYTTCFFFTTGISLICLSLATVDMMLSVNNYINFSRVFFAWCGMVIYFFYISMPGQRIIDASLDILNSVYFCGWYDFPLKTQRLLKFMMMRCSVPCQFTAGPLLVLNLENCGVILKTAMSYCTFVFAIS
ncbi:hypothetical protein TSAR_001596 [Trichomalopsis sarcophagae]|uniref:Odorant receptor n=1 Tax=Trichomalopsis sarcophagae TaxID=543379 RepID=A0A232F154_9HYME|nr:hypothetical protein TSAR_001596 [Trichomalopsis sarcophagae]